MKHLVIITGELKRKNEAQIEVLKNMNIKLTVFFITNAESASRILGDYGEAIQLKSGFVSRFKQLFNFFRKNKVDLLEVFAGGGRIAFLYNIVAKIFKTNVLLVERGGGTSVYLNGEKPLALIDFSIKVQYRYSQFLLYKEPYMREMIDDSHFTKIYYIPNAIEVQNQSKNQPYENRDIDYLWVNRVIPLRYIDWVVKVAASKEFQNNNFILMGFLEDEYSMRKKQEISDLQLPNLQILNYSDNIYDYYSRTKFFMLPAEITFGNNSLLESMSQSVVPVVTTGYGGMDELIIDGVEGLVAENNFESYRKKMHNSRNLSSSEWSEMSRNSYIKVKRDFSKNEYQAKLKSMYLSIFEITK